jgi:hypothetical protein
VQHLPTYDIRYEAGPVAIQSLLSHARDRHDGITRKGTADCFIMS